jgi:hypothetical protein
MRFALSIRSLRVPFPIAFIAVVTLGPTMSCDSQQTKDPFAADTTYHRRLAYQEQMSHAVPTDSLTHLYVRLANASNAEAGPLVKEIGCERVRLAVKYGIIPANKAETRWAESLWKAQPELGARARAKFDNAPPGSGASSIPECHVEGLPSAPESLNVMPMPTEIEKKYRKKP